MNIKEIEENMSRSLTIGDETIKGVYMTYVSPYEIEFLLTRIKALEGAVELAKGLLIEWYDEDLREELLEHAPEVVDLYDALKKLEEDGDD